MARLKAGKVAADKFDYAYLRFDGQRYGRDALARLRAQAGPDAAVVRAQIARIDTMTNRYQARRAPDLDAAAVLANVRVWPTGARLPEGFLKSFPRSDSKYSWPECLQTAGKLCDVFSIDLSGAGKSELLIVDATMPGHAAVFAEVEAGGWDEVGSVPWLAGCQALRDRLIAGQVRVVIPPRKVLDIGGTIVAPIPAGPEERGCPGRDSARNR